MAQTSKEIAIAGAGLVGSLLAAWLAKEGHRVTVYERRPDLRKAAISAGRSINLALSDRGWRALEGVGAADAVRQNAIPMHGRMIHHEDGSTSYQPYGMEGQAIWSVSRGGLNAVLMDHAEKHGVKFHFENGCDDADHRGPTMVLDNGETVKPDLLFGADGAFSRVRLGMMLRNDRFDYNQTYLPHGYKELSIPPAPGGGWLLEKNALHIWPRHDFMLIALANHDGSFTCTLFLPFEGEHAFEHLTSPDAVTAFFQKHFATALELMPTLADDFFANPTGSLVTVRCRPWVFGRRTALIGDASHAIVPFYGQGMNSGFEDCTVLHQLMQQHSDDWDNLLADYQRLRKPSGDAIADLALQNFVEMRDKVDDRAFLYRKQVEKVLHKYHPDAFVPIYSQVTFSHTPYEQALAASRVHDRFFDEVLPGLDMNSEPDRELADRLIEKWKAFGS
jgi:kynurenine 3-monooxygenase